MPHARTHMNNPKITRAPLPALLPTILTGLFILAGCGGSALPIPVIATESTDVADNLDTNPPDSILLSVGEQPPEVVAKSAPPPNTPPNTPIVQVQVQVQKQEPKPAPKPEPKPKPAPKPKPVPVVPTPNSQEQEQVEEQEQLPPPVFEVAPARPPQRSFSQSQPEPQTSTETVTRSDATGESHASDSVITFADWVDSFGIVLPTQAQTKTITITATPTFPRDRGATIVRNNEDKILAKDGGGVLTYTDQVTKNAGGDKHANGDPIIFTTTTKLTIPAPPSGRERTTAYDANGNEIPDLRASSSNYDVGSEIDIVERVTLTQSQLDYIEENAMFTDEVSAKNPSTTRTDTAGVKNQFLQGVGSGLDEGTAGVVHSRGGLNLATATFGGRKLGGDAADGVGFFRGFSTENPHYAVPEVKYDEEITHYNYAGIYSNTNLGAPVSGTGTASWNGRIRTIGYFEFDTDFTLEVTFGTGNTGTLNVARLNNPKNTNQWLMITDATYDANGVISGEIIIDEDHDTQRIQAQYGFLTGLIGEQGAVAAFLSSGENDASNDAPSGTKESITQGFHRFGYAGGFVAHPTAIAAPTAPPNLNVRINAWTSGFTNTLPSNVKKRTTNNAEPSNAFLLRKDPATRPSWKKPEGGFLALSALGGDATDGVDFFPADITIINVRSTAYTTRTQRTYHAGLWDSTDLGLALPDGVAFNGDMTANWKGKFSVFQGANARFDTDFTLAVDFINNSFSATIEAGAKDYYLSGNYDANGVMTGQNGEATARVSYEANADSTTPKNGILTGLIGQEGAVGVFLSNKASSTDKDTIEDGTGNDGFAGGFVARPQFVNYTDLPNYTDIPTTVAGLIRTANPNSRFLRIEDGARLDTEGLTNPVLFTQRRGIEGGTGFGDGYTTIGSHGYAALLPTTDLGLPRAVGSGEPTVSWNGSYSLIRAYDIKPIIAQYAPIVFSINFETGNLTGTAPVPFHAAKTITIETSFGADGVMRGTFSTDTLSTDTERHPIETTNTNVIGLIGEEGLVGIMHGHSTGLGIIATGGFVASP